MPTPLLCQLPGGPAAQLVLEEIAGLGSINGAARALDQSPNNKQLWSTVFRAALWLYSNDELGQGLRHNRYLREQLLLHMAQTATTDMAIYLLGLFEADYDWYHTNIDRYNFATSVGAVPGGEDLEQFFIEHQIKTPQDVDRWFAYLERRGKWSLLIVIIHKNHNIPRNPEPFRDVLYKLLGFLEHRTRSSALREEYASKWQHAGLLQRTTADYAQSLQGIAEFLQKGSARRT